MCEFHDCNCNGLGDIWWTDKCMHFSSIDCSGSIHSNGRTQNNAILIMLILVMSWLGKSLATSCSKPQKYGIDFFCCRDLQELLHNATAVYV